MRNLHQSEIQAISGGVEIPFEAVIGVGAASTTLCLSAIVSGSFAIAWHTDELMVTSLLAMGVALASLITFAALATSYEKQKTIIT